MQIFVTALLLGSVQNEWVINSSSQIVPEERRNWITYAAPNFFSCYSRSWLLSHLSWGTDRTCHILDSWWLLSTQTMVWKHIQRSERHP